MYALLAALVIIQFIRPTPNNSVGPYQDDISLKYPMNAEVKTTLQKACYDCHSNQTTYPWYSMIQPVGWWLQHHVDEGKEHLNFHTFLSYSAKKQDHKLEEIEEAVTDGWMPLDSYTWLHKNAVLQEQEKAAIIAWVKESRKNTSAATDGNMKEEEHE